MRIGVRAHDFGKRSAHELSFAIKSAGFETVQLALPKGIEGIDSYNDVTEATLVDVRESFAKNSLKIDVLGCYIDPSLPDEGSRLEQVAFFQKSLGHARVLGAPIVATETTNFDGSEQEREIAFSRLKDSVLRMVDTAEKEGVTVGVEMVSWHVMCRPALARRLLDEVKSERLKIVLDPVNLLTKENFSNQDAIIDEAFDLLGPEVVAMHIKDAGADMSWTNLGAGAVNLKRIFSRITALGRELPLLREEVRMDSFARDVSAMKSLIQGGL